MADGEAWTVVGVAGALAALATLGLAAEVPEFWDPCHTWGLRSGDGLELAPDGPCQARTGTSETRLGAAVRLLLVDGSALAAAGLAAWGALARRPLPLLAAGAAMAAETLLLLAGLSLAFAVPLAAAALFLTVGAGLRRGEATAVPAEAGWRRAVRWAGLVACAGSVAAVAGYAVSGCAHSVAEAGQGGRQEARCAPEVTWGVLPLLLPVLVAGAGLFLRAPRVAWAGSGAFAGIGPLFLIGTAFLLPLAAAVLACVALWRLPGRRAAPV